MRLAGYLKMKLEDVLTTMSSREFAYWQAYHRYYEPVGGDWDKTGLVVSASLAPYCPRGSSPKPKDFIPVMKPPQHPLQMLEEMQRLKEDIEKGRN
jgi:hypothetical protein